MQVEDERQSITEPLSVDHARPTMELFASAALTNTPPQRERVFAVPHAVAWFEQPPFALHHALHAFVASAAS